MRYLKNFKLFESYIEDITFYRMSHKDILNGAESVEYSNKNRRMIGLDIFNDALVRNGFPDKKNSTHMMSKIGFDKSSGMETIYGKNYFKINVDENSLIGWCYLFPINDWFYNKGSRHPKIEDITKEGYYELYVDDNDDDNDDNTESNEILDKKIDILIRNGLIGFGKLKDLIKTELFNKEALFVWTEDNVKVTKYSKDEIKIKPEIEKDIKDLGYDILNIKIQNISKKNGNSYIIKAYNDNDNIELLKDKEWVANVRLDDENYTIIRTKNILE